MPEQSAPTIEDWNALSDRIGGGLFKNAAKLEAMRRVDRSCDGYVTWPSFCDRVALEVSKLESN